MVSSDEMQLLLFCNYIFVELTSSLIRINALMLCLKKPSPLCVSSRLFDPLGDVLFFDLVSGFHPWPRGDGGAFEVGTVSTTWDADGNDAFVDVFVNSPGRVGVQVTIAAENLSK